MKWGCVYDCAHPLWGGDGTCSTTNDDEAICVCSQGYASKDALGSPSCVPTIVLWSFYLLGVVFGTAMTLFLVWHVMKYCDTRASVRSTRKAILRLQILTASSLVTGGVAACCAALAFHGGNDMAGGEANLWDFYVIQTLFVFLGPCVVYTLTLQIEYWLLGLPSQFLRSDGLAIKAQDLAKSHRIFPRTGIALGATTSAFGAIAFSGARWALFAAEMILLLSTDLAGLIMGVVGFEILAVIKLSEQAASGKNDAFYRRAKRRIWSQVLGVWLILLVNTIAITTLYFTRIGRSTPVIPMGVHFCCGVAVSCPFAHLTAFAGVGQGGESTATSSAIKSRWSAASTPIRTMLTPMMAATAAQLGRISKSKSAADQHEPGATKTGTSWTTTAPKPGVVLVRVQPARVIPANDDDAV